MSAEAKEFEGEILCERVNECVIMYVTHII